ncbi:MAG: hypothetical protein HY962_16445 [Ignavibacteriae bacterium]|nr:hypothetical protein [Ignavibacteriota bacterium]
MFARTSRFQVLKFPRREGAARGRSLFLISLSLLMFLYALLHVFDLPHHTEYLASCILALTNAFLGYVFIERAFRMNVSMSILLLLAGMGVRFVLSLAAIALFLVFTPVGIAPFVGSFMVFYTIALFAEVFYINHKTDQLKPARIPVRK